MRRRFLRPRADPLSMGFMMVKIGGGGGSAPGAVAVLVSLSYPTFSICHPSSESESFPKATWIFRS